MLARRSAHLALLALLAALFGCKQPPADNPEAKRDGDTSTLSEAELERWRPETIQLPSQFAPGLPKGVEELRFAPGMYDADAEDYWSYVFTLRFEERIEGRAGLQSVLDQYYGGLITAVAKSRNVSFDGKPAVVRLVSRSEDRYEATVDLIDAFVTGKPLTVQMEIRTRESGGGTHVLAKVSPQPKSHAVWKNLRAVLAHIAR